MISLKQQTNLEVFHRSITFGQFEDSKIYLMLSNNVYFSIFIYESVLFNQALILI